MGPTPKIVERLGETALRVVWTDGHDSSYPWVLLRDACPCAMCRQLRDEGREGGSHPSRPSSPDVRATAVKPVGQYALQIVWSDGHLTGIYAYDYLRQLCSCEACRPQQFEEG